MQDLLLLTHRIPYPPNKGDKIRSFHLLKHLSSCYRVHLGTFIDDAADRRYIPEVRELCGEAYFARLNPPVAKLRSLWGLISGEPLTLVYYRDRGLDTWAKRILRQRSIARIVVFSSAMAQYADGITMNGVRRVIDFVDVDSDKWCQYARSRRWPMGWVYQRESETLLDYERQVAGRFDACIFVSEPEARLFARLAPEMAERASFVNNGVDGDYFSPTRVYPVPYSPDQKVLVFTGAMDYWANADAVAWFAREVFPLVRQQIPDAYFYIVGARPSAAVCRLTHVPGIQVTGSVEDIRPYLAHAQLAVAPLRIARGVQNKVLEAMAMGRPVVATPLALEGIAARPGRDVLVADHPRQFADLVVEIMQRGNLASLGWNARQYVLKHYNWTENLKRLEDLLEGRTSKGTPEIVGEAMRPLGSTGGSTT
jgi:sugar transferase (PEP-CTERM/EpsH1 system associated)